MESHYSREKRKNTHTNIKQKEWNYLANKQKRRQLWEQTEKSGNFDEHRRRSALVLVRRNYENKKPPRLNNDGSIIIERARSAVYATRQIIMADNEKWIRIISVREKKKRKQ